MASTNNTFSPTSASFSLSILPTSMASTNNTSSPTSPSSSLSPSPTNMVSTNTSLPTSPSS
eukprot:CAMPEP_0172488744 /NCGR_PEP_ID=MMETSP1066-20121228/18450_1 /TAXON_ID=671091 /ORGANISM="Coscinodiscus wailesii, Strain CCMP2513" /LENGTH=60 /DNA_ID=CAMNT_0013256173 /DNA_START=8 /DNA_END=187 /DNA_ORIENTATION=-